MKMRGRLAFAWLAVIANACAAQPASTPLPANIAPSILKAVENPYAPKAEDLGWETGGIVLTSANLAEQTDSIPSQVRLTLLGFLPRTCSELRVDVADPNDQFQIMVSAYSLIDPITRCDNVLRQFETSILLGVYSAGRYTVWVNNEYVGDFVSDE
ncbi:MAG: hypothetical protein HYZ23_08770 [Chloroflexi bacterium]|nr:hypothetical protein [Chloroflexota bacterium]